jgi:hypothetical protein
MKTYRVTLERYAQEVNITLRWAPNQRSINSIRLGSLMQSDLHHYSIVSVITPASTFPATLSQRQLYPTNNLLHMSGLFEHCRFDRDGVYISDEGFASMSKC